MKKTLFKDYRSLKKLKIQALQNIKPTIPQ